MLRRFALALAGAGIVLAACGPTISEDSPEWNCATMGNEVCGPGIGPNHTDHNVYYGDGALPVIPGRVTTYP